MLVAVRVTLWLLLILFSYCALILDVIKCMLVLCYGMVIFIYA